MRLTLVLLLLPFFGFCQQKKDTKILVTVPDSISLRQVTRAFYEAGFSLDQKDEEVGFWESKGKLLEEVGAQVKVRCLKKDSTLTFTAQYNWSAFDKDWSEVSYQGMKGSVLMRSWRAMQEVAGKIGGTIRYGR
jgi:hypothetical protein